MTSTPSSGRVPTLRAFEKTTKRVHFEMSDVVARQRATKARLDTLVTIMEIRSRLSTPLAMEDVPDDLREIIEPPRNICSLYKVRV
jgi:hypothetical protein